MVKVIVHQGRSSSVHFFCRALIPQFSTLLISTVTH
ncbi:unnamed protein product [Rhodiola kirilowii]